MPQDHLAIARRRAGGRKCAASVRRGAFPGLPGVVGKMEMEAFETGGGDRHGIMQFGQLDFRIGHHDVHEIELAIQPFRAVGIGAVGDPAHFFQNFAVESAQEERVGGGAEVVPALLVGLPAQIERAALQIFGNLVRHQVAVLITAVVRLAFNMKIDPSGRGIAIGRAESLYGFARGPLVLRRHFVQAHAFEPGLPAQRSAAAGS